METQSAFQSLLLLTALAAVVPILVRQVQRFLPVPIVVGEIIAGIAVGQSGLNLVHESAVLSFLAEFGFIFLMFLSGLEVNPDVFSEAKAGSARRPLWQRPLWLAGLNFGMTLLLGLIAGLALWRWGMTRNPILMGLILSTTSIGIVVPVLKERELIDKTYGQLILLSALFSDFLTLLLLGLVIAAVRNGVSADMLFFLVLLAVFVGSAKLGRWAHSHKLTHRVLEELSHATSQIRIRGAFALIVLWVVLAGSLGVEVILGAFLAGVLIGQNRQTSRQIFEEKLDAMGYGFFIPIFFIMVGARFDLTALLTSPGALWLVPLLIVAAYLVKLLAGAQLSHPVLVAGNGGRRGAFIVPVVVDHRRLGDRAAPQHDRFSDQFRDCAGGDRHLHGLADSVQPPAPGAPGAQAVRRHHPGNGFPGRTARQTPAPGRRAGHLHRAGCRAVGKAARSRLYGRHRPPGR